MLTEKQIEEMKSFEVIDKNEKILKLKDNGLGNLQQIAEMLWKEMNNEIKRNGYSDLTLSMEGASRGIYEIIELNNIRD